MQDTDDTVTPTYSWNINGQSAVGSSINLANYAISGGDTVTCIAEADDGFAAPVTQSTSVTIDNQAPVVSSISLTPTLLFSNSTAICTVQSQDPDGDPLTETINWLSNGQNIGSGTSIALTGLASPGDTITCEVIVSDGSTSTTDTSSSVTILNTLPTAPSISLSSSNANGAPAAELHDLYCTITASSTDIDGDAITYNFEWTGPNGQTINHTNQSGPVDTLPASTPTAKGLWICSAEASDGVGVSSSTTGTIYVENGCRLKEPVQTLPVHPPIVYPSSMMVTPMLVMMGSTGLIQMAMGYQAYCDMTTDGRMDHVLHGKCRYGSHSNRDLVHRRVWSSRYRTDCREVPFYRCSLHQS